MSLSSLPNSRARRVLTAFDVAQFELLAFGMSLLNPYPYNAHHTMSPSGHVSRRGGSVASHFTFPDEAVQAANSSTLTLAQAKGQQSLFAPRPLEAEVDSPSYERTQIAINGVPFGLQPHVAGSRENSQHRAHVAMMTQTYDSAAYARHILESEQSRSRHSISQSERRRLNEDSSDAAAFGLDAPSQQAAQLFYKKQSSLSSVPSVVGLATASSTASATSVDPSLLGVSPSTSRSRPGPPLPPRPNWRP